MRIPAPPPAPRAHGGWVMLTLPMILGLAAGGLGSVAAWLIAPAVVLAFLAHYAIVPWAQRTREGKSHPPGYAARRLLWGTVYLVLAGLAFAGAWASAQPSARGPLVAVAAISAALAAVYAFAESVGAGRTLSAEVLGMAGMSLTAPLMIIAAGRGIDRGTFGPAALALAYSLSSLAFVRAYERLQNERLAALRDCIVAHVALAAGLAGLAAAGVAPRFWWAALFPVFARTAWGLGHPPRNLRVLGLRELGVAMVFTSLACIVLVRAN